jgi:hypothetical protein
MRGFPRLISAFGPAEITWHCGSRKFRIARFFTEPALNCCEPESMRLISINPMIDEK